MTTAIYTRISQDREGRELGVQRQEDDCRALAARLGLAGDGAELEVFSDNDVSATSRSSKPRPAYRRMLDEAAAGRVTTVISYSTSRLTRRPREFEDLIDLAEKGLRVATVQIGHIDLNTGRGRERARNDAARDAGYADEISELVKRKKEDKREKGEYTGGRRPFGFEADGMTPRPVEQDLIRSGAQAILAGRSINGVARDWSAAIEPPTWHAPLLVRWKPNTVRGILLRERAVGRLPDGRPALWAPVLDEATWLGVKALLSNPTRRNRAGGVKLLSGIATCGVCGRTINASRVGEYRCLENRCFVRKQAPVEGYVAGVLLDYLARERVAARPASAGASGSAGELAGKAAGLRARLVELEESAASPDGPSPRLLAAAERRLSAELEAVEAQIAATAHTGALAGLPLDREALAAVWEAADTERRRAILAATPLKIAVLPPGRGARVFDPATVRITGA